MNDLEFRKLYHKILQGLLSIEVFSLDYFSLNRNIREIVVIDFLQIPDMSYTRKNKKQLLTALQEISLDYTSDAEVFVQAEYLNAEYYVYLVSNVYSLFSDLSEEDKRVLAVLDLCCNSKLKQIFQSKKIPFYFSDFCYLMEYVLGISEIGFKEVMSRTEKIGLVIFNEAKNIFITTTTFNHELLRLSTIPTSLYNLEVNDFVTSEYDNTRPLSEIDFIAFAGNDAEIFIYTKLLEEKIRFWYATSFVDCNNIIQYLNENNLDNSEYVWLSYREAVTLKEEANLIKKAEQTAIKFIISGSKNDLLGRKYSSVELKCNAFEKKVDKLFSQELAIQIHNYLSRILPANKKREFVEELIQMSKEMDFFYMQQNLPDIFNVFKQRCKKDEIEEPEIITPILEEDFVKRYGQDGELFLDNQGINARIRYIHNKLIRPATYLKATKSMLYDMEKLIHQHPNVINIDDLYLFLKSALVFSKNNIINTKPILFVGGPGTGKTMLARELRELFGQDYDCYIPCGSGLGVAGLVGCTPEYKGATNGKILASIWEALDDTNCLNPVIVLDEFEKSCLRLDSSDVNQNVYPTLNQLFGEENKKYFTDNFFEIPIRNFSPIYLATANAIDTIPDSLFDRTHIIRFRDYNQNEIQELIIPFQYNEWKKRHKEELLPEELSDEEIKILYKMSRGNTRKIQLSISKLFAASYDIEKSEMRKLSAKEIDNLIETSMVTYEDNKIQIGFCR